MLTETAGVLVYGGDVRGRGVVRVYTEAGWNGAMHWLQLTAVGAAKTWQYSSGSRFPQNVP